MYFFLFSVYFRYIDLVHESCNHLTYIELILFYILMYVFHLPFHVLFLFSLYAHTSYYMYVIYYFCFTQRCRDEFCLTCSRNTGC